MNEDVPDGYDPEKFDTDKFKCEMPAQFVKKIQNLKLEVNQAEAAKAPQNPMASAAQSNE